MHRYRAALLGKARHLHHAGTLAIDMGRLGHHGADGHNAGAADPGDHRVERALNLGQLRHRQVRQINLGGRGLLQLRAFYGHKTGAEAVHTAEIFVAAGLIDGTFTA